MLLFRVEDLIKRVTDCVYPENIHTSPTEEIFFIRLPTLLEIPIKLHTCFGLTELPTPQEIPIRSICGGSVDIFLKLYGAFSSKLLSFGSMLSLFQRQGQLKFTRLVIPL